MAKKKRSRAQHAGPDGQAPSQPSAQPQPRRQPPAPGPASNGTTTTSPRPARAQKSPGDTGSRATTGLNAALTNQHGSAKSSQGAKTSTNGMSGPAAKPAETKQVPKAGGRRAKASASAMPPSPPPSPVKRAAAQRDSVTTEDRAAASSSTHTSPAKNGRSVPKSDESKQTAQQAASASQANGKASRAGARSRRHSPAPPFTPATATPAPVRVEPAPVATEAQPEPPSQEIKATSVPKKGATATALTKAIKSAMSSLAHGLVSAAYSELLKAVSPDAPEPDGTFEEHLESVSILVSESFRAAKKSEAKEVLQKLDEAEKLWPITTATLPKGVDTTAADLRLKCMRLHAHVGLNNHEKVVEMSEPLLEQHIIKTWELFARMNAAWETTQFAKAAQAARFLARVKDPDDPRSHEKQQYAEQIVQAVENRDKGAEAFKTRKWERAIAYYRTAVCAAKRTKCGRKSIAALYFNLGMVYLKGLNYENAADSFTDAIAFDPDHVKALRNRAIVFEQLRMPEEALEDLEDALSLAKESESRDFCAAIERDIKRVEKKVDELEDMLREHARYFHEFVFGLAAKGKKPNQDQHFRTLGVEPGATEIEIKAAFKSLALKHHPDKGGDAEKFKEIRHAYGVLTGQEKGAQGTVPDCPVS